MTARREASGIRGRFPACCALLGALILLRDGFSVPVGRSILLFAATAVIVFLNADETRLFVFFLLPLYPGLPGNYLTLLLVGKLLFLACREPARFRFSAKTMGAVLFFAAYLWGQNLILGEISAYSFALGVEWGLLFLLASDRAPLPIRAAVLVFSFAVMLSGTAALFVFANEHSFAEIFSGAVRFGDIYHTDGMHMTLDPNFLGFSCLAGMAAHAELVRAAAADTAEHRGAPRRKNGVSFACMAGLFFFGTVGLSRTFLLCTAGLAVLELAACLGKPRAASRCLAAVAAFFACAAAAAMWLAPELFHALVMRFSAADFAGANGRAALLARWYDAFTSSPVTLFFGVGLFRTNVHVTALQYLFGLGLFGFFPAVFAFAGILRGVGFRFRRRGCIPAVTVAVMSCAVPAACSLSALFPLFFAFCISGALSATAGDTRESPSLRALPKE